MSTSNDLESNASTEWRKAEGWQYEIQNKGSSQPIEYKHETETIYDDMEDIK
jgi:hypothetical protein